MLNQILNDMWIIESIENGKLTWQPASMDLVCFCRHLVKDFQLSSSPQRQLTFVSQGDCINVQMDENLLRNIITNLLSNAIKFSPQESPVQFDLGYNSCSAIFRIQDSGIGIPLEDKERIFEVFSRWPKCWLHYWERARASDRQKMCGFTQRSNYSAKCCRCRNNIYRYAAIKSNNCLGDLGFVLTLTGLDN
jgi:hypothetical protein